MKCNYDSIIVGGGLVGLSIAYGLARRGQSCLVLDGSDTSYQASRGNFGLVWVQGKGVGFSSYADWTLHSSNLWSSFRDELQEHSGKHLGLVQKGGIHICLSNEEFESRKKKLDLLQSHQNGRFSFEMLDRKALLKLQPGLGNDVVGGSWCEHDGHVNPLYLLRSLHDSILKHKGQLYFDATVSKISYRKGVFDILSKKGSFKSSILILAAGLGNSALAPFVGLKQPVRPQKGQILVTQKVDKIIRFPMAQLRQTAEGSIMIGDSKEEVGFDISSSTDITAKIALRAQRTLPALKHQNIVRNWAALRVMSPDGYPIYDQSITHPGAFAFSCHSGVTLAPAHCFGLATDIELGRLGVELHPFSARRFDVS